MRLVSACTLDGYFQTYNTDVYSMPFAQRDRSASGRLVDLYCGVDVVLGNTPQRADTVKTSSLSGSGACMLFAA